MTGIHIQNVSKQYGAVQALDTVSLTLEPGKIYGLLGRNGAGKTTLLNILSNRIFADGGQVQIDGLPAQENDRAQAKLYMMSEQGQYPPTMRVGDVFKWTNTFYDGVLDLAYANQLCEAFGLDPRKKLKQLSTGYGSIYKIITALSLRVPYLLLDEPVLGLDANHRELFYRLLLENFSEHPRTIVLSTHLIEEISTLIEEVIIIQNGRVIRQASSESLLGSGYTVSGPAALVDAFTKGKQVIGADLLGGLKSAYIEGVLDGAPVPEGLEIGKMDLQKLFIQLTNQGGEAK